MQNSGAWDLWLPVVKNSRLFAQRGHSAQCAPLVWETCCPENFKTGKIAPQSLKVMGKIAPHFFSMVKARPNLGSPY